MDRPGGIHLGEFSTNEFDLSGNRIESTNSHHLVVFGEGQVKAGNHLQGLMRLWAVGSRQRVTAKRVAIYC